MKFYKLLFYAAALFLPQLNDAVSQVLVQGTSPAVKALTDAADVGDVGAQLILGEYYFNGWGVPQNIVQAYKWNSLAVGSDIDTSRIKEAGKKDWEEAEKLRDEWLKRSLLDPADIGNLIEATGKGNPRSEVKLGHAYINGRGVDRDPIEAVKWFRKAADQGHVSGQYYLGIVHVKGGYVFRDRPEALKWLHRAADQEFLLAYGALAEVYASDNNYSEALKWIRKSAEKGFFSSQYSLGRLYYEGKDIPQDFTESAKWCRMAAEQGYSFAQFRLGTMYEEGKGVNVNFEEAVKWYRMAAEQRHSGAMIALAKSYYEGRGIEQDYSRAYMWLTITDFPLPNAKDLFDSLTAKMTPQQIEEGRRLSQKWNSEHEHRSWPLPLIYPNLPPPPPVPGDERNQQVPSKEARTSNKPVFSTSQQGGHVKNVDTEDQESKLIRRVEPEYPYLAKRTRTEGVVALL